MIGVFHAVNVLFVVAGVFILAIAVRQRNWTLVAVWAGAIACNAFNLFVWWTA